MVAEADSEHVVCFAFGPLCAWPNVGDGIEFEGVVGCDSFGVDGWVKVDLDAEVKVIL